MHIGIMTDGAFSISESGGGGGSSGYWGYKEEMRFEKKPRLTMNYLNDKDPKKVKVSISRFLEV